LDIKEVDLIFEPSYFEGKEIRPRHRRGLIFGAGGKKKERAKKKERGFNGPYNMSHAHKPPCTP
jgi:hypothetical protein